VFFIGNSLTDYNDLPALVRSLSTAAGLNWVVEAQTLSSTPDAPGDRVHHAGSQVGLSRAVVDGGELEDHWNRGIAIPRIQNGNWDVVVLQQGPSAQPETRAGLRKWTARFNDIVREAGGRSALYMVWPMTDRFSDYDRVRDSYALAARDVGGFYLPAGESWRAAWREHPAVALYGPDGFHPTLAGSYAAALTIFVGLAGISPLGLPAPGGLDGETAELLQRAAQEAIDTYGDYQPPDQP